MQLLHHIILYDLERIFLKEPPDQGRVIEQAKLIYYPLGKAFEKQRKTIQEQGKNK